jgi:hypothetical protein
MLTNESKVFSNKQIIETQMRVSFTPEQAMKLVVMLTSEMSTKGLDDNLSLNIKYEKLLSGDRAPVVEFEGFMGSVNSKLQGAYTAVMGEGE